MVTGKTGDFVFPSFDQFVNANAANLPLRRGASFSSSLVDQRKEQRF
jgi:hypothetical protein